ncbi:hypothetical protein JCM10213_007423 [Rhodosporidiobolus nylandii]
MAAASQSAIPPTLLPSDPKALSKYLRTQQLASLRHLYEHKTLAVTQQFEERAASMRGRHGRARRRRGSSPLEGERDPQEEEDEDDLEVRKRMRYEPSGDDAVEDQAVEGALQGEQPAKRPRRPRQDDPSSVDPAHAYDLVFDLAPDSSADAYYHGPHPPPPSRVVRSVLRASQKRPFVDPEGLSTAQLEALTSRLWQEEGHGISVFFGDDEAKKQGAEPQMTREQERYQRELNQEAADEWEAQVIAGFSAACDEKIGRTLARKPMTAREMQALAAQQAAQQQAGQAQPSATAQAQAHPAAVAGYAPAQLSPFGDRERFAAQQAAPYWR